jgi:hypothetical protein
MAWNTHPECHPEHYGQLGSAAAIFENIFMNQTIFAGFCMTDE